MKSDQPDLHEDPIREHVFDGIQEYDKRLPNWWLWTLHGAIVFSALYWFYYEYPGTLYPDGARVEAEMARIALAAQNSGAALSDEQLWTMSRDLSIVSAGKATYLSTCASCHNDDLSGKIGPNLKDNQWRHGGLPHEVLRSVTDGVTAKGMPSWGPVLGRAKTAEVAAYLLSYHSPDAPILKEESAAAPAPAP